ncbi:PTS system mannose/fructose/N-acetylgalactosamine-transporter subunit IIB [Lacrimispora indolis]|uniref:PTS system mannose/fructose/N-acetylgalactosamine-transporter subunit IIB n=1 Tax=Lacrimispora indolis TaxID=69825 RepID=UPI00040CC6F6|nr:MULTISPECIES: PTS sugar transporter subunit IIB [Lachnospiraceae]
MMEIVNVRIDDRLIHGQVATVWSQVTGATRIMVVDDQVVKDTINKEALKLACPKQCKLSILTVEKAAANLCAGKYQEERVFLVAKSPKTMRRLYDAGFHMDQVNVGNMGGKQNTRMLKKAVSVSEEDIADFLYLSKQGVIITAQMVPADDALDFIKLINEHTRL